MAMFMSSEDKFSSDERDRNSVSCFVPSCSASILLPRHAQLRDTMPRKMRYTGIVTARHHAPTKCNVGVFARGLPWSASVARSSLRATPF